jgi:hypothetical protein
MIDMTNDKIVLSGLVGLVAALLVGTGEFLLHYTSEGYGSDIPYQFMMHISTQRLSFGHFIAVLSAPLYLIGFWHMYKMLEPAGGKLPAAIAILGGYGFIMGIVWIGSRSMIASIVQLNSDAANVNLLINSYQFYDETLLQIIRLTTLLLSLGFFYLVLKGKTNYPVWMSFLNPFFLLLAVFSIYLLLPIVGKFIMPIAMNVAYAVFFSISTCIALKLKKVNE